MKQYIHPEMEIFKVAADVITTSDVGADNLGNDGDFQVLPALDEGI
ncbi:MAG: hypothetical protein IJY62_04705 [Clostridia bacterium]|nr:hypothetical protein [Clostridia bacterium]